jgi:hypothetical protein
VDLGFLVYFLVVFVFGSLLLLALVVYFLREFVIRGDRPSWSERTLNSKALLVFAILMFAGLIFVPLRMMWVTRIAAVLGKYSVDDVWGNATLEVRRDGSFTETWHFKNEYNGKDEGGGSIQGRWQDEGRDWLTRNIVLEPFTSLAEWDRGHIDAARPAIVEGYSFTTAIDVDPGADITLFR